MNSRPILVQKFGGTSVSTPEARQHAVGHVRRARDEGYQVAIVVSAMGRRGDPYATDTLLDLLRRDGHAVDPRDYNLMFICGEAISVPVMAQTLRQAGIPATGLTSVQARIYTDGNPLEAEITRIDTGRLRALLAAGEVPVVTGGQGVDPETLDFQTIGRGGSDTSGVAVGVALGAERVEIFTDVECISATDPRLVPEATRLREIGYARMGELARWGAKVVHPRAILTAARGATPIVLRSTFSNDPGTMITDLPDVAGITGIAALPAMETVLLAGSTATAMERDRWERRSLVMSVIDHDAGELVLGAGPEKLGELEAIVSEAGGSTVERAGSCSWISVIGADDSVREMVPRALASLKHAGVAECRWEVGPGRATFIVPESSRRSAVQALYTTAFGAASANH